MSDKTLLQFADALERAAHRVQSKNVAREARRALLKVMRRVRDAVAADLASATFPAGAQLSAADLRRAIQVQVLKGYRGARILMPNKVDRFLQNTGRARQPRLPLAFWLEHGYAGQRLTRRTGRNRGPQARVQGVGALLRHADDIRRYESEIFAILDKWTEEKLALE